ncbi:MAG: DUF2752 domain-containing protein [Planctomycetota bacterium]
MPPRRVKTAMQSGKTHFTAMLQNEPTRHRRLAPLTRIALATLALTLVTLLGVARTLSPNQTGLGTHQQLGLPPCSMVVAFGIRCPACGMTTSWAYFTRGQWLASLNTNPGGFLLAGLATIAITLLSRAVWRSQAISHRAMWRLTYALLGTLGVTGLDWLVRFLR